MKLTEKELEYYRTACPYELRSNVLKICFGKYFKSDDQHCYTCELNKKCYLIKFKSESEYRFVELARLKRKYVKMLKLLTFTNHLQFIMVLLSYPDFDYLPKTQIVNFTKWYFKKYYKKELRIDKSVIDYLLNKHPKLKLVRGKPSRMKNPIVGITNEQSISIRKQIQELREKGEI